MISYLFFNPKNAASYMYVLVLRTLSESRKVDAFDCAQTKHLNIEICIWSICLTLSYPNLHLDKTICKNKLTKKLIYNAAVIHILEFII